MKRFKFDIKLPVDVIKIHEIMGFNNYELFLIGGAVRDSYLEIEPKDWDLVTNANPNVVIELLKNESFIKNIIETPQNLFHRHGHPTKQ